MSEEVSDALSSGIPVVALESNVITHGFTYPDNVNVAQKVEAAVRKSGAVPATIALDDGAIVVGMTSEDIEKFATMKGVAKVSARDMAISLAKREPGATTVSASLAAAHVAGITYFASAGIGGVHRGAETNMDISSDLIQFTRSDVAVVCAGAKNILDLPLTMEFLETHGVPMISYGSDFFPAFLSPSSGIKSPSRCDDEYAIATAIENHWAMGNRGSILVTSPIRDEDSIASEELDAVTREALVAAERDGIRGKALTKYLMNSVDKATEGRSSRANMSVLISTAELAGRLARSHSELKRQWGNL